jgi:4-oxalocrotonate tautomerase
MINMPMVQISMVKGRTKEQIEGLIKEVSKNVSDIADCPITSVHVVINEVESDHWGLGGETVEDRMKRN